MENAVAVARARTRPLALVRATDASLRLSHFCFYNIILILIKKINMNFI